MRYPIKSGGASAERFLRTVMLVIFAIAVFPAAANARVAIDPKVTVELHNDACDHYEQGDFVGAKDRFLAAVLARWKNPYLFYNLGNSYFRMGDLGRAILFYERAKNLAPRDASIAYNLNLARSRIVDKVEPSKHNILAQLFMSIYLLFNVNEWTVVSLTLYLVFMALGLATVILRGEPKREEPDAKTRPLRRLLKRIAAAVLALVLFSAINTVIKVRSYSGCDYGIIVAAAVKARSGPKDEFAEVFELHSGTKVRVRSSKDDWFQISLESGLSGWLPKDALEVISYAYGQEQA